MCRQCGPGLGVPATKPRSQCCQSPASSHDIGTARASLLFSARSRGQLQWTVQREGCLCTVCVWKINLLLFSPLWCSSFKQQIHFKFMMFFSLKYVDITKNYKQCLCFLVNTHIWIWCLDKAKSICTILQSFHKHNLIRYTRHYSRYLKIYSRYYNNYLWYFNLWYMTMQLTESLQTCNLCKNHCTGRVTPKKSLNCIFPFCRYFNLTR